MNSYIKTRLHKDLSPIKQPIQDQNERNKCMKKRFHLVKSTWKVHWAKELSWNCKRGKKGWAKEVQIVYRLFLVNCYLLHVPRLPFQSSINNRGWVIEKKLAWTGLTRNNLSIIWISLDKAFVKLHFSKFVFCTNSFFLSIL